MAIPFTRESLEASLVAIDGLMATMIVSGNELNSYTLPTGVTVNSGSKREDLIALSEHYQKLLRSYYPTMAISQGY